MRLIQRFLLAGSIFLTAWPALAGDLNLEASLIWAANEPSDPHYVPVDADLSGKLHRMFRWNNYVQITNQLGSIPLNQTRDFRMSDNCLLKVRNLGDSRIQVSCIGEGKEVSKGLHTLAPTQWLVLGGNAKNDTAWFIGLRSVDPALAQAKR